MTPSEKTKAKRALVSAVRGRLKKAPSSRHHDRSNRKRYNKEYRTTETGWLKFYFGRKAQNCRGTVLGSDIKSAELQHLWKAQQGLCALSGVPMTLGGGHGLTCVSVDRINHGKPYTLKNVRLTTWQANSSRLAGSDSDLIDFCQSVLINFGFTITGP